MHSASTREAAKPRTMIGNSDRRCMIPPLRSADLSTARQELPAAEVMLARNRAENEIKVNVSSSNLACLVVARQNIAFCRQARSKLGRKGLSVGIEVPGQRRLCAARAFVPAHGISAATSNS